MPASEVLYIILLAVLIVVCVFLIFVLWRLYRILTAADETMEEIKSTTNKVSGFIKNSVEKFNDLGNNIAVITQFFEKAAVIFKEKFSKSGENKR